MDKNSWVVKLKQDIIELNQLREILVTKNPTYPFLYQTIEDALYSMACLLAYIEEKNPYLLGFREDYFLNRNVQMHTCFIADLHKNTETGLIELITNQKFHCINSLESRVNSIITRLQEKVKDNLSIASELSDIRKFAIKQPSFSDRLECIFKNINGLNRDYVGGARIYFNGISKMRNSVSHPNRIFTEHEIAVLKRAKLGKAVNKDGNLCMTFEGYRYLLLDVINFFDTLYANL